MIYLFAGHHLKDPGASGNGYVERDLTIQLRDLVAANILNQGVKVILDKDHETLAQVIDRIKPGSGSVLCDLHYNASDNPEANGMEVIVKNNYAGVEHSIAALICSQGNLICGHKNRGVKTESQSHRGRLGILHTAAGISVLVEKCFITNANDMRRDRATLSVFARALAQILIDADSIAS